VKATLSLTINSCARRLVLSGHRRVVLEDDLDLPAGDGVALLLHVQLDGIVDLLAGRGLATGHRHDQADLDGFLRLRGRQQASECDAGRGLQQHPSTNEHQRSLP